MISDELNLGFNGFSLIQERLVMRRRESETNEISVVEERILVNARLRYSKILPLMIYGADIKHKCIDIYNTKWHI